MTRRILGWWRRLVGYVVAAPGDDFEQELESHLQLHIDDGLRAGMTRDEARRHALIRLGGVAQVREQHREQRGIQRLEEIVGDARLGLRMLRRNPGFSAVALLTLAIGIGANTVMFSVVNTVLLRPLPYADPDRLMFVQTVQADGGAEMATSPPDFYTYRQRNQTLEHLDAFYTQPRNLTGAGEPERVPALVVSSGFFSALGIAPAIGRGFVPREEQWGSHRVAVLSDGLWRRRFAADPAVLGHRISVDGEPFVVVGVMPPAFTFLNADAQLFVPMSFQPGDNMNSHSNYFLSMVGRLRKGVTREQAAGDLNRLSAAIIAEQSVNQGTAIAVTPLHAVLVRDVRQVVLVLSAAVGLVLLIACANLANLLLARAVTRQREVGVRLAVGGTRARVARQFLIESVVLTMLGGAAGVVLAILSIDVLNLVSHDVLPRAERIQVDLVVLAFAFGIATLSGIALGLAPALYAQSSDISRRLKDGAPAAPSSGSRRVGSSLVVAQVGLSLVLLAGAGLLMKSLYALLRVEIGIRPEGVLTLQVNLPARRYVDEELERRFSPLAYARSVRFFRDAIDRIRAVPGAEAVGAINGLPLMGEIWSKRVTFFDRPLPRTVDALQPIQYRVVAGDYFRAMGVRVVSGRAFTDHDTADAPKVVIVNREMVRRYWNGEDPIGRVLSVNPPLQLLPASVVEEARRSGVLTDGYEPARFTVVGVVDDVRYGALTRTPLPLVYAPYAQGSEGATNMFLVVRTQTDPLSLVNAIREQIAQIDREQPLAAIQTMAERVSGAVAQERLQVSVLGGFALLALLLAATGIYGVMSYAVVRRSRELGIRVALGARRSSVLALVMRQGFSMIALGVAGGLVGALAITRTIRSMLFAVSSTDPAVFAATTALLALVACTAAYIPARRATRVDPLIALRAE